MAISHFCRESLTCPLIQKYVHLFFLAFFHNTPNSFFFLFTPLFRCGRFDPTKKNPSWMNLQPIVWWNYWMMCLTFSQIQFKLMLPACAFELTIVDDVLFPDEMDNWQNEEKIKYKNSYRHFPRFFFFSNQIYLEQCNNIHHHHHQPTDPVTIILFHLETHLKLGHSRRMFLIKKSPIYQETVWWVLWKLDIYWGGKCYVFVNM